MIFSFSIPFSQLPYCSAVGNRLLKDACSRRIWFLSKQEFLAWSISFQAFLKTGFALCWSFRSLSCEFAVAVFCHLPSWYLARGLPALPVTSIIRRLRRSASVPSVRRHLELLSACAVATPCICHCCWRNCSNRCRHFFRKCLSSWTRQLLRKDLPRPSLVYRDRLLYC